MNYQEFLKTKVEIAKETGFEVDPEKINKALKPHQRDSVIWALRGADEHYLNLSDLVKPGWRLSFANRL